MTLSWWKGQRSVAGSGGWRGWRARRKIVGIIRVKPLSLLIRPIIATGKRARRTSKLPDFWPSFAKAISSEMIFCQAKLTRTVIHEEIGIVLRKSSLAFVFAVALLQYSCGSKVKDKDCKSELYDPAGSASPRISGTSSRPDEAACRADCEQLKTNCTKGTKAAVSCVWDGKELISKNTVFDCR
jgi:hypothetical protein